LTIVKETREKEVDEEEANLSLSRSDSMTEEVSGTQPEKLLLTPTFRGREDSSGIG